MSGTVSGTLSLNAQNFIANLVMAGQATEKEGKRMAGALKYIESQLRENERAARGAANTSPFTPAMASDLQRQQQEMRALRSETNRTREAMRQLPAQFTDVFTQLAGGQNPLLILIQQGGQIRDAFGGVIPALRGIASAISPVTVAIGALAAAGGAFAYAFYEGTQQSKEFRNALVLTGNAAGVTAGMFDSLVKNAALAAKMSQSAARESGQLVVASGQFGPGNVQAATEAVLRYQKITGDSADKVVGDFAQMSSGVAKWAEEHNRRMNFITAAKYEEIKAAEQMGDKERAVGMVLQALNAHLETNRSFWDKLKQATADAWDTMVGSGRDETAEERLDKINTRIESILAKRKSMDAFAGAGAQRSTFASAELEQAQQERTAQLYEMAGERRRAFYAAESARVQQAAIAASAVVEQFQQQASAANKAEEAVKKYRIAVQQMRDANDPKAPTRDQEEDFVRKFLAKNQDQDLGRPYRDLMADIAKYEQQTNMLGKAVKAEGEVEAWAADKRKAIADNSQKLSASEKALATAAVAAAEQRRIATLREMEARDRLVKSVQAQIDLDAKQYARVTGLLAAGDETVKGYIQQEQEIGKTAKELEKLNLERKLEIDLQRALAGVTNGDDASAVYAAAQRNAENARRQLEQLQAARERYESDPSNGVTSALQKYQEDTAKMASKTEQLVNGSLQRAEDAFVKFARTGKLALGDLFGYWVDMVMRLQFQQWTNQLIKAGGGANNFSMGTLWDTFRGWAGFANGMEYVPYDGFPAILHEGERVQTKMEAQSYRTDAAAMSSGAMQGAGGPPVQIIVQGDFGENARKYMEAALKTAAVKQQRRRGI